MKAQLLSRLTTPYDLDLARGSIELKIDAPLFDATRVANVPQTVQSAVVRHGHCFEDPQTGQSTVHFLSYSHRNATIGSTRVARRDGT